MKSLIICASVSNGNTRRVADSMAEVLGADVVTPEAVDVDSLGQYDLIGFGSGVYFMAVHPRLWNLVRRLPVDDTGNRRAFTFFTSGARRMRLLDYGGPLGRKLAAKGFDVLDSFWCLGCDTVGPLKLLGGVNKGRPNETDLEQAAEFTERLRRRVEIAQAPPML
ncbi:MAG: flavodoxin family protein [Mycolicibacterium rufum]|nr:flavodoxin family protein [Mycolicibacterium rufum]